MGSIFFGGGDQGVVVGNLVHKTRGGRQAVLSKVHAASNIHHPYLAAVAIFMRTGTAATDVGLTRTGDGERDNRAVT